MESERFDALTRNLGLLGTRRSALVTALGGTMGFLALADTAAGNKHRKKKRRRKQRHKKKPVCAGKDWCGDATATCDDGSGGVCQCFVTAESGEPFCGGGASQPITDCSECPEEQTCIDCAGILACSVLCPNPL